MKKKDNKASTKIRNKREKGTKTKNIYIIAHIQWKNIVRET